MTLHVTKHALERAIERIPGIRTEDDARLALSSATIQKAAQFGAPFVKLGTGQHVVIHDRRIVTVLARDHHPSAFTQTRDAIHRRDM